MINIDNPNSNYYWKQLFLFLGIFVVSTIVGALASQIVMSIGLGGVSEITTFTNDPYAFSDKRDIILIAQGMSHVFIFLVGAWLFLLIGKMTSLNSLFAFSKTSIRPWLIIILVMFIVQPFVSFTYEWNSSIVFPEALKSVENVMKLLEEQAKMLTEYMVDVSGFYEIFLSYIVIALLAAVGEELVFRGLLQKILIKVSAPHFGILFTAFLFSAIHGQFYGFLPRFILGALFGYLYFWSKNLWMPILAHFINNATTLTVAILFNHGIIDSSYDETTEVPVLWALLSLMVTISLLVVFQKNSKAAHE